jgi:sRNA-binding carbon storage regulator CsrA
MLILTRQPGQIITIQPREDLLPGTLVTRLFADGPIEVLVTRVQGNHVCLGIQAHSDLLVNRGERKMQGP